MTDPAIIAASYAAERNYSHNPDDVIDASDAVGAWGTAKESTTELVDLSGNNNIADIHGAMPTEGFIQGRRFDGDDDYLGCGNDSSLDSDECTINILFNANTQIDTFPAIFNKSSGDFSGIDIKTGIFIGKLYTNNMEVHVANGDATADSVIYGAFQNIGLNLITVAINSSTIFVLKNGVEVGSTNRTHPGSFVITEDLNIGNWRQFSRRFKGNIFFTHVTDIYDTSNDIFNTIARLPFWSVDYANYPDNTTEYTDNLPYSSSIISSGTFKVDDDKLQCVSAGTITYSASYDFDGSEFIKVTIGGVEYAGTGTITQGNTTVSVAQGSNKVTIVMGTGDKIEDKIKIQFRDTV